MSIFHQPWRLVQNQVRSPGGYAMDVFRGIYPPKDIPNGSEAWVGSITVANGANEKNPHLGCSEVDLPDGRRMYLFEAIDMNPETVLGQAHIDKFGKGLGVLVKLLDAKEQYFLQAHPTRETAKELWNSDYGKEECWYIIATRDDTEELPYLLIGFQPGTTQEEFIYRYRNTPLSERDKLCHKVEVHAGEAYFVPGGMAHALGAGCLVLEVQEPSDLAVVAITQQELLDYRRKANPKGVFYPEDNDLYEKRLFNTFLWGGEERDEVLKKTRSPQSVIRSGEWGVEHLIFGKEHTKFFSCTKAVVTGGSMPVHSTGDIRIGVVLKGSGHLEFEGGTMELKQGDEIFFPCDIPGLHLAGEIELIFCNPGDVAY